MDNERCFYERCANCEYYFANPEMGICTIDKEQIDVNLAEYKFCAAFSMWWGAVE